MTIQIKAIDEHCFPAIQSLLRRYKIVCGYICEILKCDHSNESYWAVLSCGVVYHAVQGGSNF